MTMRTNWIPSAIFLILLSVSLTSAAQQQNLRVWYRQPAKASVPDKLSGWENDPEWLKALPIGNGHIGAMVFGDINRERIQLNEKTLWSGSPNDDDNPEAFASLGRIRQLLSEGKYREATDLTLKTQVCRGAGSGQGNGANVPFGCYQTLGVMWLIFGRGSTWTDYSRELDLSTGLVKVTYQQDGIRFTREIFASYPDRALIMRLRTDTRGAIRFNGTLTRPERARLKAEKDHLLMFGTLADGKGGNGMNYAARLKAVTKGGSVRMTDSTIDVRDADEVMLVLTASTDYKQSYPEFRGQDPLATSLSQLEAAADQTYDALWYKHSRDFSALSRKMQLRLSAPEPDTIPTDVRLRRQQRKADDLRLQEIYFQFGRYLLISSSREGTLPANLQGIWANQVQTPWNGDYHTDINVQMNYWPSDLTNLSECHGPLTAFIESLQRPGMRTASVQYKAGGWVVHPISNVWGYTAPGEHPSWGMHLGAGAWLCQHLWEHYLFTMDRNYLERVYPVMRESARFYLDWLVRDPVTGKLVSGPAASPENSFEAPDGSVAQISMGPSHDQQVIGDLFTNLIKASEVLKKDDSLLTPVKASLKDLATTGIGKDGRLMEWRSEFPEKEPTHRHVSHLYMLHPGNSIDPESTPELAKAAAKSLEQRTDEGTGWSLAWKINFHARLKDGAHAYLLLKKLLRPISNTGVNMTNAGGTYPNLFCGHPPFQIDGNFGATAGMAEMLLQSHVREGNTHVLQLLPALPAEWSEGEIRGVRARGNFEVIISWKNGRLYQSEIRSLSGSELIVNYAGKSIRVPTVRGQTYHFNLESFR
jgi:alpha-L-fucosidase 2